MKAAKKLKSFTLQSKRVWKILKRPSGEEFKLTAKVSIIGVLILGLVGFLISSVMRIF